MTTRTAATIALLLLFCACSGTTTMSRDNVTVAAAGDIERQTTEDFDVSIEQTAAPMAMPVGANDSSPNAPLDVQYGITIGNRTAQTVTVKKIALSTAPGLFTFPVTQREFKTSIAPGASGHVEFWATGTARDANIGANAPTVLRARITLETSGGGTRTETFLRRVNGAVSAGVS
jgi:hypothetical protein